MRKWHFGAFRSKINELMFDGGALFLVAIHLIL